MGITYQEVVENNLISEDILDCIPQFCECGAPVEFTDSLAQIYCSDSRCPYKVAARLEAMAKAMKADGFGASTCITLCKEFGIKSPFQIFLLEDIIKKGPIITDVAALDKKIASICDPAKRKVELWQVVKLANIPNVDTLAYKIFNGYDTISDAYADIETGQVPFIANKLGIKNSEAAVMAAKIYKNLIEYKAELLFGETKFEVYKPTGKTVYIAITGGVDGFRNKSEFIDYLNNKYSGKINAMLMNTVTTKVDILIADGDTSHRKYSTAIRLNEKYLNKGIESGEINPEEVGLFKNIHDIHPVGELIFITDSHGVMERLDKAFG